MVLVHTKRHLDRTSVTTPRIAAITTARAGRGGRGESAHHHMPAFTSMPPSSPIPKPTQGSTWRRALAAKASEEQTGQQKLASQQSQGARCASDPCHDEPSTQSSSSASCQGGQQSSSDITEALQAIKEELATLHRRLLPQMADSTPFADQVLKNLSRVPRRCSLDRATTATSAAFAFARAGANLKQRRDARAAPLGSLESSAADLVAMTRSSLRHNRLVMSESSTARQLWDVISAILIFYSIVIAPLDLAFGEMIRDRLDTISGIEIFVDSFFVADIALNFFTSYMDVHGNEVFSHYRIARTYVHMPHACIRACAPRMHVPHACMCLTHACAPFRYVRTWLAIDLAASIPFSFFEGGSSGGGGGSASKNLIHAYMHMYIRAYVRTYTYTWMHAHVHACT